MTTTLYVRNRREAALVAKVARRFGCKTSIHDIYQNDRYLINIGERLFGAHPEKGKFLFQARQAVIQLRQS